jgi:hypothetical protein
MQPLLSANTSTPSLKSNPEILVYWRSTLLEIDVKSRAGVQVACVGSMCPKAGGIVSCGFPKGGFLVKTLVLPGLQSVCWFHIMSSYIYIYI